MKTSIDSKDLKIEYVPITDLKFSEFNPRKWTDESRKGLTESLDGFGFVQPLVVNSAPDRKGVTIGGNFKLDIAKKKGMATVPVVWVNISDIEREKELNLRLNKNQGEFDWSLLANFDEAFLQDVGFSSEEIDHIFPADETPEKFDLEKELKKLKIDKIDTKKGDIYQIGPNFRLMNGDSMVESDVLKLMDGEKADMVMTDPPYLLDYLHGKKKSKANEGFGYKRDRKYLGTDSLPDNFTELWMNSVSKVQKPDFSIMIFENPKNLRTIWNELEKHWKYRNTIVWRLPNRVSGFSAKYRFFNKHDVAILGTGGNISLNLKKEDGLFKQEYENALFATSGKPHWESYEKGKKICPTDFIDFKSDDAKHSGQGIIFGTKPIEILIPYIKVLTKRGDLVLETFGGSGSTGIAALKLGRRCFMMEKSEVYTEVIKQRVEKLLGVKAVKIHGK